MLVYMQPLFYTARFLTLTENNILSRVAVRTVSVSRNDVQRRSQTYVHIFTCDVGI